MPGHCVDDPGWGGDRTVPMIYFHVSARLDFAGGTEEESAKGGEYCYSEVGILF